ncbi:hypothetical protein ACP70R_043957 [Stipagrostis hirtigluma subsp. patula]
MPPRTISVCHPLPHLLMAAGSPRGMAAVGWDAARLQSGPSLRRIPSPSSLAVILLLVTTPSHLPPAISTLTAAAGDTSKQEADRVPPRSGLGCLAQRRLSVW